MQNSRRFRSFLASLVCVSAVTAGLETTARAEDKEDDKKGLKVGDWLFTPDLQLRVRGEGRANPIDLRTGGQGIDDASLVWERARLGLDADRGVVFARILLQDARAWGDAGGSASLMPYEAFGEVRSKDARPSYLRIGRQEIRLGSGRLIGTSDVRPAARSFDAARAHLAVGKLEADAIAILLRPTMPGGPGLESDSTLHTSGDQLYAGAIGYTFDRAFKLEAFGFLRVGRSLDALEQGILSSRFLVGASSGETGTVSLRASGEGAGFKYGAEGAFQFGNTGILNLPRSAFAAHAQVSRDFDDVILHPELEVGASYASGDDHSGSTYQQFDPLVPELDSRATQMQLFAWSNTVTLEAKLKMEFSEKTSLAIQYRYARLAKAGGEWLGADLAPLGQNTANTEAELGHEIAALMKYKPLPEVTVRAGYEMFVLGQGAAEILKTQGFTHKQGDGQFTVDGLSHLAFLEMTVEFPSKEH